MIEFLFTNADIIPHPLSFVNPFFEKNPIILIWLRESSRFLAFLEYISE